VQAEKDHELDLKPEFMPVPVGHWGTIARVAQTRFVLTPPRPADRLWSAPNGAGCKDAAVTILAFTGDLEGARVEKLHQPVPRPQRKLTLILARAIQLRRVKVGDADLFAPQPHGITIVDTVVTRPRGTDGERGSEQEHGVTLPRTSSFSYLEQMWNMRSRRVGGSYDRSKPVDARCDCVHHHSLRCPSLVGAPKAMSSRRLDSIADYSRHGYALRIDCLKRGRVAVLNPLEITMTCQERGWSKQMSALDGRLRCSRCGSRTTSLGQRFAENHEKLPPLINEKELHLGAPVSRPRRRLK